MSSITNSICSFGTELQIQSGGGLINIGDYTGYITIQGGTSGVAISAINNSQVGFSSGDVQVYIDTTPTIGTFKVSNINADPLQVSIGNIQSGSTLELLSYAPITMNTGIATSPVASSVATSAFGASLTAGTALHNTTGYNLLVNISVSITAATTATIVLGVGSTSTPTTNTVVDSFTTAAVLKQNFCAMVPNNYYLLVNTTGTITIGSITIQSCPL